MKFRSTWILLGIAVLFGLYIYFIEYKKAAKDEELKDANEKILNIDQGKIKKIEIKNANGGFVAVKDAKGWNLEAPIADSADETMITGILGSITTEKFDQSIEGESLKQYGLDNPKSSVTVTLQDGSVKTVSVGADAPLSGKIYLQRSGEKDVLYANSAFKTQLERSIKDLRDKRIFRKNKEDIEAIKVKYNAKNEHGSIGLTKKGAEWALDEKGERADLDAVKGFINAIDGLRATDFSSEKGDQSTELKKYGLDRPEIVLNLEKDNKPLAGIIISPKKDNDIYMKVDDKPTIYQGYVGAGEQLMHKPDDFRDKKEPFKVKKEDVADITVKVGSIDWHLAKKGMNWESVVPDPKKEVSQIQVANFLDKIEGLRISEFMESGAQANFASPRGAISLKDLKGQEMLMLKWAGETPSKRSFFTTSSRVPYVFGVDNTALNGLTGQPLIQDKASIKGPAVAPGKTSIPPHGVPAQNPVFTKPPPPSSK